MVFDLELYKRLLRGAQQKPVAEHQGLQKSKTIYPPLQIHLLHRRKSRIAYRNQDFSDRLLLIYPPTHLTRVGFLKYAGLG